MANPPLFGQDYTPPALVAKVTGRANYAEDYRADGMLFCKLMLSPMPHGRIRRIDAAALAMEGVKAVLTADDVPDMNGAERVLASDPSMRASPLSPWPLSMS
jgi:xanthine dehydrogenase molybdenum-binding subunit